MPAGKSKSVLIILTCLLGYFGADRFYMRCYRQGFLKLFLLIGGIFFFFLSPPIGILMIIANIFWTLMDQVIVLINALTASPYVPATFCKSEGLHWDGEGSITNGRILAAIFVIFIAFSLIGGVQIATKVHNDYNK